MEGSVRVLPRHAYAGRGACFASASSSGSASVSGVANNNKGNKTSGKKGRQDDNPYQKTVLLPKTEFGMRANAKKREPELQEWWREKGIYEQLIKQNKGVRHTRIHLMPLNCVTLLIHFGIAASTDCKANPSSLFLSLSLCVFPLL